MKLFHSNTPTIFAIDGNTLDLAYIIGYQLVGVLAFVVGALVPTFSVGSAVFIGSLFAWAVWICLAWSSLLILCTSEGEW